jgi:hypothetical protein
MLGLLVVEVKSNILLYLVRVFFEFAMHVSYLRLQLFTPLDNFSRDRVGYDFEFMLCTLFDFFFEISNLQNCQRILHNIFIALDDIILGSIGS